MSEAVPATHGVAQIDKYCRGDPASAVTFTEVPLPPAAPGQVVVKMAFAPINPSDVNVLEGVYVSQPPALPANAGMEGSGVVVHVEPGSEDSGVKVGDHVCSTGWNWGSWQQYAVVEAKTLRVLSKTIDLQQAAMLHVNPPTAYGLLHSAKEGDWVIQNAANSGMGLSVIQVAKLRGIKTVNIVRREGLEEQLKAAGADVVVVYAGSRGENQKELFNAAVAAVKAGTGGAKIHLACDAVCGLSGELLSKCLAPYSKMLTYGVMSQEPMTIAGGSLLFKMVAFEGFHLMKWLKQNPGAEAEKMWAFLVEQLEAGKLTCGFVEQTIPLSQIKDAVAAAFAQKRGGKVLIDLSK